MTEPEPPGIDPTVPSPARMYDYYLGGKDNYAVDREAAEEGFVGGSVGPEDRAGEPVFPVTRCAADGGRGMRQ